MTRVQSVNAREEEGGIGCVAGGVGDDECPSGGCSGLRGRGSIARLTGFVGAGERERCRERTLEPFVGQSLEAVEDVRTLTCGI